MADNGENVADNVSEPTEKRGSYLVFTGGSAVMTNRETYRKSNRAQRRQALHAKAQHLRPYKTLEENAATLARIKRKEAGEKERIAKKKEQQNV